MSRRPLDVPAVTIGIILVNAVVFALLFLWVFGPQIEDAMGRQRYSTAPERGVAYLAHIGGLGLWRSHRPVL